MATMFVEYRDAEGFPGYQIGSDGNLRKCTPGGVWVPVLGTPVKGGYRQFGLRLPNGRSKSILGHVLVLTAFKGPKPDGLIACHENDIHHDNRIENLRWDTYASNEADKRRNGNSLTGTRNHQSSLNEKDVREIRRLRSIGIGRKQIGLQYGVTATTIYHIDKGRNWSWVK